MDYGIFNVHTDVNACDCTQGCTDTVRESALGVDSGRKISCCTGKLNMRAGPMCYQLSYITTLSLINTRMIIRVSVVAALSGSLKLTQTSIASSVVILFIIHQLVSALADRPPCPPFVVASVFVLMHPSLHQSYLGLMRSLVTSIFLYACESWTHTAELQRRMRCYCKLLRIS